MIINILWNAILFDKLINTQTKLKKCKLFYAKQTPHCYLVNILLFYYPTLIRVTPRRNKPDITKLYNIYTHLVTLSLIIWIIKRNSPNNRSILPNIVISGKELLLVTFVGLSVCGEKFGKYSTGAYCAPALVYFHLSFINLII